MNALRQKYAKASAMEMSHTWTHRLNEEFGEGEREHKEDHHILLY